jgi:DNA-directed RNA polymerase specialized sigma24 family protein
MPDITQAALRLAIQITGSRREEAKDILQTAVLKAANRPLTVC